MTIPPRGRTSRSTYFISSSAYQKENLLQSHRMAGLFVDVLLHYRQQKKYLLHEFVVMPDHFHLLITPADVALERALQFVKGGFSYRAKNELGFRREIWQTSFHDHRVRDAEEYAHFRKYIHENPVKRHPCRTPEDYPYSSANGKFELDPVPQWLKPLAHRASMQA